MFAAIYFVMKAADIMAFIFVFPGSLFIIAIYLRDWLNSKRLSITDHLLAGLSVYNFLNGVMKVIVQLYLLLKADCLLLIKYLSISYLVAISGNLCFCTWLSIYFCLKIVTCSQTLYVCLQKMFPKMIPWLLVMTVLFTLLVGVTMALDIRDEPPSNMTGPKEDLLLVFYLQDSAPLKIYIATCLFAFLLYSISFVVVFTSLCRHIKLMRNKAEGLASNVYVHIHTVKMLAAFFIYNVVHFSAMMMIGLKANEMIFLYSLSVVTSICLVLNTVLLIKGNCKLRKALDHTLKSLFSWLK